MVTAVGVSNEKTKHEASEQARAVYPIFAATRSDDTTNAKSGLAFIHREEWKLKDKEAVFRQNIEDLHRRMNAFVAPLDLLYSGSLELAEPRIMSRDGLWSGLYVLAEICRYRETTGEGERLSVKENAWRIISKILEMEKATLDENADGGYLPATYAPVEDATETGWHKGDKNAWLEGTDAASLLGWVMALSLFHEEMADDDQKIAIENLLRRVAIYLAANSWRYIIPGSDTPEGADFSETMVENDSYGPLRALQLLAILRAIYSITEDPFAYEAYVDRAWTATYAQKVSEQKTAGSDRQADHAADLEAFMAFHLLLHYSNFAELRPMYESALKSSWELERNEQNPFFNFVAGAVFHENIDVDAAILTFKNGRSTFWIGIRALAGERISQHSTPIGRAGRK